MSSPFRFTLGLLLAAHGGLVANAAPPAAWPYWPEYKKTPLDEIRPQKWRPTEHVIDGWDWSLPPATKPAPNGLLAVYRTSNINRPLNKEIQSLDLPINQTLEFWVKWRDLEPVEGQYRFDLLLERMREGGFNLGGEQSGHIILHDHATTGDGLMSALQVLAVLVESGRPMSELAKQFDTVPQKLENVPFTSGKPLESAGVKAAIADAEARLAGVGRLLVRPSGTEKLIRVMAEGDDAKLVKSVVADVVAAVKAAG